MRLIGAAGAGIGSVLMAGVLYWLDYWSFGEILAGVGYGVSGLAVLAIVGVLMLVVIFGERNTDEGESVLAESALLIRTGAAVVFLGGLAYWFSVEGAMSAARSFWWLVPLLLVGYVLYLYLSHRRNVASASTALDRTQRSVQRNISSKTEAVTGTVVLGFALAAAIISGAFAGLSGLGDVLLMFAGEATYLLAVLIGYEQLGGSLPYLGWLIPDLGPRQWVGITLLLGALAIMVKDPR